MLQITLDVFSGRPNPTWFVEEAEARELLQDMAKERSAILAVHEGPQGLGYRGIIVETLGDTVAEKHDLPATFRIAKRLDLAERVLNSTLKASLVDDALHSRLIQELQRAESRFEVSEADVHLEVVGPIAGEKLPPGPRPHPFPAVTCWIELGAFNPGFWNDPAHIYRNNCYNYASNRRTDTFAQPGRATGHQATTMACLNVTAGALSDGLHHRYNCFPDSEKPRWLMAMVVAPGYDYHWYRKQKEGFWGHKPGGTAARNVDNNGAIVWNPETAARQPYTDFCGYFYSCRSQKIN
jgi:hypothetical protein